MSKMEEALKTTKVYLASLSLKNDVILNNQLINWFIAKKYRYSIFQNGVVIGQVYYLNDQINILIKDSLKASINVEEPYQVEYEFKTKESYANGQFKINTLKQKIGNKYFVSANGKLENLEQKVAFALNEPELFKTIIKTSHYEEKLIIDPKNYIIDYAYENNDVNHKINYEVGVNGLAPCMLAKPTTFITHKCMNFNSSTFKEKNYFADCQMFSLMKELDPNFQNPICETNEALKGWLSALLTLAYPEYKEEEIGNLFGLAKKNILIANQNLIEYWSNEHVKTLKREK